MIVAIVTFSLAKPATLAEITKAFQEAAGLAGLETMVMNTNSDAQRLRPLVERLLPLRSEILDGDLRLRDCETGDRQHERRQLDPDR
jgi:DNA-binding LacI/PurR family transcriptional regulator